MNQKEEFNNSSMHTANKTSPQIRNVENRSTDFIKVPPNTKIGRSIIGINFGQNWKPLKHSV